MNIKPQSDYITLETIVDRHGLHTVVKLLGILCGGKKAEHMDTDLAQRWDKAGWLIDKLASQIDTFSL